MLISMRRSSKWRTVTTPPITLRSLSSSSRLEFDAAKEEEELSSYLGDSYDREKLKRYRQTLDDEYARFVGGERDFYRASEAYLYDLTVFAMSGTKLPYLEELTRRVPPGSRVLDYGCGIGSDGLRLLEAGYKVEFADFDNPSVAYLRWRLARRGIDAPVHNLDAHVPGGFDAAYAFDVIEHVGDPFAFLADMERRADLIEVNFLASEPDEPDLHHELPIRKLLRYVARRSLIRYRLLHRRSHLVLYRPEIAPTARRYANFCRLPAGRLAGMGAERFAC
jgi:SAM-dependent methyltransferase